MAFQAHRERIKQLLAEGCPQVLIHQEMHRELNGLSYSQFSRLIRKYIFGRQQTGVHTLKKPVGVTATLDAARGSGLPSVFRGFEPGPKVPNIDELF